MACTLLSAFKEAMEDSSSCSVVDEGSLWCSISMPTSAAARDFIRM